MVSSRFLVKTLADVAAFCGVALQTVKQWRVGPDPMPGQAGAFDLAEIHRWRVARAERLSREPREGSRKEQLQEGKLAVDIARKQLLLERLKGTLVDAETVARLFERSIHEHNAQANQLKDRLLMLLPEQMADGERRRLLDGIDKALDDMRHHLAEAAETWEREADS